MQISGYYSEHADLRVGFGWKGVGTPQGVWVPNCRQGSTVVLNADLTDDTFTATVGGHAVQLQTSDSNGNQLHDRKRPVKAASLMSQPLYALVWMTAPQVEGQAGNARVKLVDITPL